PYPGPNRDRLALPPGGRSEAGDGTHVLGEITVGPDAHDIGRGRAELLIGRVLGDGRAGAGERPARRRGRDAGTPDLDVTVEGVIEGHLFLSWRGRRRDVRGLDGLQTNRVSLGRVAFTDDTADQIDAPEGAQDRMIGDAD